MMGISTTRARFDSHTQHLYFSHPDFLREREKKGTAGPGVRFHRESGPVMIKLVRKSINVCRITAVKSGKCNAKSSQDRQPCPIEKWTRSTSFGSVASF